MWWMRLRLLLGLAGHGFLEGVQAGGRAVSIVKYQMCRKRATAGKRTKRTCAVHAGVRRRQVLTLAGHRLWAVACARSALLQWGCKKAEITS